MQRGGIQALVASWSQKQAPRTVRRQYDVVRAILNSAVASGQLAKSPCRGIKLPYVESADRQVLDMAGLATLAAAVGPNYEAMVFVGAVLGSAGGSVPACASGGSTSRGAG